MTMKPMGGSIDKKMPRNPKFDHVKSGIDTGAAAKTDARSTVSSAAVAKRRDELFKRIKASTLARLVKESEVHESVFGLVGDQGDCGVDMDGAESTTNTYARSVTGVSTSARTSVSAAETVVSVVETDVGILEAQEHMILDLRETSEFAKYHVQSAINYPAAMLARDQYPSELFRAKRDPKKIVIVYHSSDSSGAQPATVMVQKGFENLYMLSGGMEDLVRNYPELIEGDVPMPAPSSRSGASTRSGTNSSRPTTGSSVKSSGTSATRSSGGGPGLGGGRSLGVAR